MGQWGESEGGYGAGGAAGGKVGDTYGVLGGNWGQLWGTFTGVGQIWGSWEMRELGSSNGAVGALGGQPWVRLLTWVRPGVPGGADGGAGAGGVGDRDPLAPERISMAQYIPVPHTCHPGSPTLAIPVWAQCS